MSLQQRLDELLARLSPEIAQSFRVAVQDVVDNAILKQVIEAIERNDYEAAFRALGYSPAVFNPFSMALQTSFEAGGLLIMSTFPKYVADAAGVKAALRFDVRDPRALAWLQEQSSTLITGIEDDMRHAVRNTMSVGFDEGRNPRSIALDIVGRLDPATNQRVGGVIGLGQREEYWSRNARRRLLSGEPVERSRYFEMELRDKRFDGIVRKAIDEGAPLPPDVVDKLTDRYRANALRHRGETIGRTEALHALNRSEWLATKQAIEAGDLPESAVERYWDSAGDRRVRPSHKALDGQMVKGMDQPFVSPVTGARMLHPGDTSLGAGGDDVIACRCRVRTSVDWFAGIK